MSGRAKLVRGGRQAGWIGSGLVHAALTAAFLWTAPPPVQPPPVQATLSGQPRVLDKQRDGTGELALACPDTYEGIGVEYDGSGQITYVGAGWPAERAGLRVGDYMLDVWGVQPVDGWITLKVRRAGAVSTWRIPTEQICQRKGA